MVKKNLPLTDLKGRMRVGAPKLILEKLESKNIGDASFSMHSEASKNIIKIKGNAVFEDLDAAEDELQIDKNIFEPGSPNTILSDLSEDDIYLRIRYYYMRILDKCLGKSTTEQEIILFGKKKRFPMAPGLIENSEVFIRNMPPLNPTDLYLKDLSDKIFFGILEYAFHAKDEFGVKMSQYAKTLKNRV